MVLLPGSAALVQPLSKKVPGISLLPNAAFNCRDRGDSPPGSHPGGGLSHREARLLAHGGGGCAVLASRAWERKWWLLTQHQPEGGEGVEELSEAGRK